MASTGDEYYSEGEQHQQYQNPATKKSNNLPVWGNEKTMNMNNLILTNILNSHYFKTNLFELKTYHEVVDEIYYKVTHLEPWEKGSRKTSGQTGMCGGVRGVGAGGIVSTAFCLLYKLFTLKLTRKQLNGLINHCDSPYIRGLGFMYIRYTQPPADLFGWYEPYFEDDEEVDPKAGGGHAMTMGEMVRLMLTKLDWYDTLFPRIPVPIQISIDKRMGKFAPVSKGGAARAPPPAPVPVSNASTSKRIPDEEANYGEAERHAKRRHGGNHERDRDRRDDRHRDRDRDRERDRKREGRDRDRSRSRDRHRHRRSSSRDGARRHRDRSRSRDRDRKRR